VIYFFLREASRTLKLPSGVRIQGKEFNFHAVCV